MRILLSAYACKPNSGSEPGVGWGWAQAISRRHETWVLTTPGYREPIEAAGGIPGVHFVYVRHPLRRLGGVPVLGWTPYYLWQLIAYRRARALHREVRFDLCHHVTFASWRVPSLLWRLGIPLVWGPLGGGQVSPRGFASVFGTRGRMIEAARRVFQRLSLADPLVRATVRRAAVVVAANSATKEFLRRLGRANVEQLLETAAPDTIPAATARAEHAAGPFELLWVGAFHPRKALPLLLEAIARLAGRVEVRVTVVGDGIEGRRWRSVAARLGVADRVHFAGILPFAETLRFYESADAFVFTSLRDTSGNVLLEAMTAGLPIVAIDWAGARDMVDESCAITIRPTSPGQVADDLAAAIERLAGDAELRRRLGAAARQRVKEQFTWDRLSHRMSTLYEIAVADSRATKARPGRAGSR